MPNAKERECGGKRKEHEETTYQMAGVFIIMSKWVFVLRLFCADEDNRRLEAKGSTDKRRSLIKIEANSRYN